MQKKSWLRLSTQKNFTSLFIHKIVHWVGYNMLKYRIICEKLECWYHPQFSMSFFYFYLCRPVENTTHVWKWERGGYAGLESTKIGKNLLAIILCNNLFLGRKLLTLLLVRILCTNSVNTVTSNFPHILRVVYIEYLQERN